jgi:hypothetical protein
MSLPAGVSSHHTAWVAAPDGAPHPVRYAVDGDRLVCFGDDGLVGLADRARVSVSVHEIAGGQAVARFGASLQELAPDAVALSTLSDLLEHVALGRTLDEVRARLDEQRARRRIVALVP